MVVGAVKNKGILLSKKENFMLPIYEEALEKASASAKKIGNRYVGSLLIKGDGSVWRIDSVQEASPRFIQRVCLQLLGKPRDIKCSLHLVENDFVDWVEMIANLATESGSYSVWGQFYDSKAELKKAVMGCKTLEDLFAVFRLEDDNEFSKKLV